MRYLACGLLYARLLILDYCLNVPGSMDTFDSRRWLLLQAATPVFNDVFAALFRRIADLFHGTSTLGSRIIDITQRMFDKVQQQLYGRPTASPLKQPRFILALDDAQKLNRHYNTSFEDTTGNKGQSVAAPILHAFRRIVNPGSPYKICVMPSGTGLSRYELEHFRGASADDKEEPNDHEESEEAGMIKYFPGWADEDAVFAYVKRLGQAVDDRARARLDELFQPHVIWQLYCHLHGRFRPLVATIERIIEAGDPSRWADVIKSCTNCLTTVDVLHDPALRMQMAGGYCLELQQMVERVKSGEATPYPSLSKDTFVQYRALMNALEYATRAYTTKGSFLVCPLEIPELVEAAVGRLQVVRGERCTVIDEPLAFKALDNYLQAKDPTYCAFHQKYFAMLPDEASRGKYWKYIVPTNLMNIFHDRVVPTALFAEGKPPHAIFQHRAMIVGHGNARQMVDYRDVTMRQFLDAHVHHGSACEGGVMPPFYIAKPHKSGPSIVFVVRFMDGAAAHPNGIICPVFVQLSYGQELYYDDDDDDARETAAQAEKHAEHDIDISAYCAQSGCFISLAVTYPAPIVDLFDKQPLAMQHSTDIAKIDLTIDRRNIGRLFDPEHVRVVEQVNTLKEKGPTEFRRA
ncbi:hypothetical protein SYNPS1DRAFT_27454 [Syncephalis pseudoplumigaleata]|uniref:Uncharacterized protein n=1 Tax=Syncephalis pseudoplumigaleata TaxID=1712513 RepID=A0A4V1J204_9FUNG|nr:hypothetical protein SYNPS1DRAFT_27454 [Syncephalis pseudoplumigaleata]|eukprot:RKP26869.1 hypothetical protein SYNPS1DRAFT_27454 [Syncephalis pseudoplumigaleata]